MFFVIDDKIDKKNDSPDQQIIPFAEGLPSSTFRLTVVFNTPRREVTSPPVTLSVLFLMLKMRRPHRLLLPGKKSKCNLATWYSHPRCHILLQKRICHRLNRFWLYPRKLLTNH